MAKPGAVDIVLTQRWLAVKHRLAEYEGAIYIFRSGPILEGHFLIGWSPDTASGQTRRRHTLLATSLRRHRHIAVVSPAVSRHYVIKRRRCCTAVPALLATGFT